MRKFFYLFIGFLLLFVVVKTTPLAAKFSSVFFQFFFTKDIILKKIDNQVNILILGIGGGKHEGPDLTDTIIFASIDEKQNKLSLISIPRDLWVPDLLAKINTAYAFGNEKEKGGGITLARAAISKIVGKPIQYVVVINFDGFVEAVSLVGGLDIQVDSTLDDPYYPIEGEADNACDHSPEDIETFTSTASAETDLWDFFPCRYEHVRFDKGLQHMDGIDALKFVRSRHAVSEEGTDFARSKRQTKVIAAFKEKLFSAKTLLNPIKLLSLYDSFSKNIDTDITRDEIDDFLRLTQKMKNITIQSDVLDSGDEEKSRAGLLMHPDISETYKNQWVLIPRVGHDNFSEIQAHISCILLKEPSLCPVK